MTGFARRERAEAFGSLAWELRSVNHRYLEVSLRLHEEFRAAEGTFRQAIAHSLRRGKVEASLYFRPSVATSAGLELNEGLLEQLIERAVEVRTRLAGAADIDVVDLLRWPGVVREAERDNAAAAEAAQALLGEALAALDASRASEGERITDLLLGRCAAIESLADAVSARLPEVRERIRAKLNERLGQVAVEPNRERLEQELVIALQKMDVDEELDRLRSHVAEVRKVVASGEPAGRKLDFLMQEFNREANTLSSKSQDVETTRAAVEIKVLVEQMREQVQNVE
ncbi:MAG: YicC family protein [Steroidobacteraceae bacterium]|nr:YicC family protein [Steroidobacteraceae bacterium]